ncbi:ATP-binding protein [Streptomyces genisteinicus]|uniref:ATP-binding protein n=1 Tax=Streptomyces genisteinicus TaxID=2768068 RepID=A0A7H0I199_9ACTN|nr:ATP-binding protein [Streptomyces genisteinicus]QNP66565.1 ATP-binding protein [Streptomyces genisteinicus]
MNHPALPVNAPAHAREAAFTQLLSPTRRGARLARLLAVTQLRAWSAPLDLTERAELVVAELSANAVLHGLVPGRCFRLSLAWDPRAGRLLVEVTDARGDRFPRVLTPAGPTSGPLTPGGLGMTLVAALADRWECVPCPPGGKTVRAVLTVRSDV